ncbi:MAG: carboxypeptidase-like regulatory domain-containing protein, partial [Bryobacteraceae bacterium]
TVEHATKQPVPRVLVIIAATDGSHREKACLTDANGAFRFENIPAGKYVLNAERPGRMSQAFHGGDGFVTGIAVGPGRDSEHIVFELRAGASLAGTVMDDYGEPVRYALVYLLRKGVFNGTTGIHLRGTTNTNTSGRFHFGSLPPGTYFAAVSAQPWYTKYQTPASSSALDVAYPITYYADAVDPASASPIALAEGRSANIQITLHAVPTVHVTLDRQTDQPNRGLSISATTTGPGGYPIRSLAGVVQTNTHFELTLAPGEYALALRTFAGSGKQRVVSRKLISVQSGSDPEIKNEAMASVAGKAVFVPQDRPPGIGVVLSPVAGGRRQAATIQSDGSFQFASTASGRYRIQLTSAPEFRITQVTAKGAAYADGVLKIEPGAAAQISAVAARAESHVDGIALKNGKPFPGAMVLLLPLDMKTDQFVGRDQSDSDGTFSVLHVPNGRYVLLAIDNGRELAYRDPAVIAPYRSGGLVVNVPASGGKVKINVLTRRKRGVNSAPAH